MTERLVVADIGGTHARFAVAERVAGEMARLSHVTTLPTAAHDSLAGAFARFRSLVPVALPDAAVLAVACPTEGEVLHFTNNPWAIRPVVLAAELGMADVRLINDFEAVAHAVALAGPQHFERLCGPLVLGEGGLPRHGVTSIIGPGTGLGVAMLVREGKFQTIVPTEAGHIGFAPIDGIEDLLLTAVRRGLHGRVSVERLVSGPGLAAIHLALGGAPSENQKTLWADVMQGDTAETAATLARFLAMLGGFAGDIALAQGAKAVVIAGGLAARLGKRLEHPSFEARFCAKGRFSSRMAAIPVMRLLLDEPGLLGASAVWPKAD